MGDRCRTFSNRCIRDARHAGEHEYATSEDSLTLRAALDEAVALLQRGEAELPHDVDCTYRWKGECNCIRGEFCAFLSRIDASDKGVR
jgi:hypothetical protein